MITLVMAYYDNPEMLKLHLAEWSLILRSHLDLFHVIIVDDGSPNHPAAPIVRSRNTWAKTPRGLDDLDIRVMRIDQNIPWNQDGARNLGMYVAKTKWCLMTDMDHMLECTQIKNVLEACNQARPMTYYMPPRKQQWDGKMAWPHANSYLFAREEFWIMGGYDEDFAGVYGSDGNFRKCMRAGLREQQTQLFHLIQYRRDEFPDASTNEFGRKESKFHRSHFPLLEAKNKGPAYKAKDHMRFPWHEERV